MSNAIVVVSFVIALLCLALVAALAIRDGLAGLTAPVLG